MAFGHLRKLRDGSDQDSPARDLHLAWCSKAILVIQLCAQAQRQTRRGRTGRAGGRGRGGGMGRGSSVVSADCIPGPCWEPEAERWPAPSPLRVHSAMWTRFLGPRIRTENCSLAVLGAGGWNSGIGGGGGALLTALGKMGHELAWEPHRSPIPLASPRSEELTGAPPALGHQELPASLMLRAERPHTPPHRLGRPQGRPCTPRAEGAPRTV